MRIHCACPSCGFKFAGGAVCTSCTARFAMPTIGSRGPHVGEEIVLHRVERKRKSGRAGRGKAPFTWEYHATNARFTTTRAPLEGSGWGIGYPVEELRCPDCLARGTLVVGFEDGSACPKCRDGRLDCDVVE